MGYELTSVSPVERVDEVDKASPKFCFVKSSFRSPMDIQGRHQVHQAVNHVRAPRSGKSQKSSHSFADLVSVQRYSRYPTLPYLEGEEKSTHHLCARIFLYFHFGLDPYFHFWTPLSLIPSLRKEGSNPGLLFAEIP